MLLKKFKPLISLKSIRAISGLNRVELSGERGIRTPGTSRFNGFQDRRNRPLCQLSAAKVLIV